MKNYFKHLTYYTLSMFGSILNLVCALFGCYPQLELGVSFLVMLESKRILRELDSGVKKKQDQLDDAEEKVKLAKELS